MSDDLIIKVCDEESSVLVINAGERGAASEVPGPTGPGVPVGGTAGQHLAKIDGTDLNTEWATPSSFDQDLNTTDAPTFTDLALNNGLTPTSFTLTNTDDGAGNSETGYVRWVANTLEIGTEAAGTGVVREIRCPNRWRFTDAFSGNAQKVAVSAGGIELRGDKAISWSTNINSSTANTYLIHTDDKELTIAGDVSGLTKGSLQLLNLTASGTVTAGVFTFATLPTPAAGMSCYVSDASVVHAGNSGTIVAGGGANFVPVYYDGTNWRIS
jgi:hypothetical protein